MVIVRIISIILLVLATTIHLIACGKRNLRVRRISKIFLMPLVCFIYLVWAQNIVWPVLVAMFFGWLGDIFLIFPDNKKFQSMGILSFGVGHIFYVIAMCGLFIPLLFWAYVIVIVVALAASAFAYSKSTGSIPANMRVTSIIYYLLLTSIAAGSGFILASGQMLGIFLLIGSWLFLTSDTILVIQMFTVGNNNGSKSVAVMSTYILAQVMLCIGFAIA